MIFDESLLFIWSKMHRGDHQFLGRPKLGFTGTDRLPSYIEVNETYKSI
jgi:hypothetical protein